MTGTNRCAYKVITIIAHIPARANVWSQCMVAELRGCEYGYTCVDVLMWDEDLRTLTELDYVQSKEEDRYVCFSRINRRLTGRAKQVAKSADRGVL